MTQALVRWANMGRARVWDIICIRDIVETKIVAVIPQNPKDPSIVQADVRVRWEGEKHPAKIIAVGSFTQVDKKCNQEIKRMYQDAASESGDNLDDCQSYNAVKEENERPKSEISVLQEDYGCLKAIVDHFTAQRIRIEEITAATREWQHLHEELRNRPASPSDNKEERHWRVHGQKQLLRMIDLGPKKSRTCYAPELLRQLFEPAELAGTSLTGRQSNAHKDKDAKQQLDPIRVNAVIRYTCKKFCLPKEALIRASFSSMLNKEKAP